MVLRDRKNISTEGIVFVFIVLDKQNNLVIRPKIASRGFVFEKESEKLYLEAAQMIEKMMKPRGGQMVEITKVKKEAISNLEDFFFKARGRRPLIVVEAIQL